MKEFDLWGNEVKKDDFSWFDMPKFTQNKKEPFHIVDCFIGEQKIKIRFEDEKKLNEFFIIMKDFVFSEGIKINSLLKLGDKLSQKITDKTKSIWFPYKAHRREGTQPTWRSKDNHRNKYPIYIISKGRHKSCITARELISLDVDFSIVVEPQEYSKYKKEFPNTNIIKTNFSNLGQGSIPVRNFVWDHSIKEGHKKHWILDDNIEHFHILNENEKYRVADGAIFRLCEIFTDRFINVKMSGMNYHSFCKASDAVPPYYLNTRVYSCTLIDNSLIHRWRGKYNEDTDLSLRTLKDDDCTILFNMFLCGKVTTQRMKGGNTNEVYEGTDDRREFAESLRDQHPDLVEVVRKFNRWHHKVNYKLFKKNKLELKYGLKIKEASNNYGLELF